MRATVLAVIFALVCSSQAWPKLKLNLRAMIDSDVEKAMEFCEHNHISPEDCKGGIESCNQNKKHDLGSCVEHHIENGVVFPEIRKGLLACDIMGVNAKDCMKGMQECADNDHLHFAACAEYHMVKEGMDCSDVDCGKLAEEFVQTVKDGLQYCDENGITACDCKGGIRECIEKGFWTFDECKNYHESKDDDSEEDGDNGVPPAKRALKKMMNLIKKK